eukprot:COSAG06_NODE_1564_length_9089_cov_3.118242_1_plen_42_part_10
MMVMLPRTAVVALCCAREEYGRGGRGGGACGQQVPAALPAHV